jgi:hypothetical protein
MRRLSLATLVIGLLAMAPTTGFGQSFNLRDLLTSFLRAGITLAPPQPPFPSHEAHFIGENSPQFLALGQFNTELATQLASFPLASSAGGFTYRYDPALGAFTRVSESFGPIYAERADTLGKGKFNLGVNYSHFDFDRVDDLSLRNGQIDLVFTHIDVNGDHSNLEPWFEGDLITAQLYLKIQTDITAFLVTYGVTDRLDVGVAIPEVHVAIDAMSDATIQRIASGATSTIHQFTNGTTMETFEQRGSASGVGDVVLRSKFRFLEGKAGGLAFQGEVRLPTGNADDLLGTGATQGTASLIGSLHAGNFSPHINAGYTWSTNAYGERIPDEVSYTGGFDWAVSPRMTLAADVLGRTFRNSRVVRVVDKTFQANTNSDPTTPPVIITAVFPELVSEQKDSTQLIGSVGVKINPFGNFLLTLNGLFSINRVGLQSRFAPLIGADYSF